MALLESNEGQQADHPEERLEGVHGEEPVDTEVLRHDQNAEHRERLGGAASAKRPAEQTGEEDAHRSSKRRRQPEAEQRVTEEGLCQSSLHRDSRSVIDVAPGQVAAAGNIVELVAKITPAQVCLPQIGRELNGQLDQREAHSQTERACDFPPEEAVGARECSQNSGAWHGMWLRVARAPPQGGSWLDEVLEVRPELLHGLPGFPQQIDCALPLV